MCTLRTEVIWFLAQYFFHTYQSKNKSKRMLQHLNKELPGTLMEDIDACIDTLNGGIYYNELDIWSLCLIYIFIIVSFTIILFLFLILIL